MIAADTGFLVALFHAKDSAHNAAKGFLQNASNRKVSIITTSSVITELFHLLEKREHFDHLKLQSVMSNSSYRFKGPCAIERSHS